MAKKQKHDGKRPKIRALKGTGKRFESKASKMDRKLAKPDRKKKLPKAVPLPGLEDARIGELDAVCDSIADVRETMNGARSEENELKTTALQLMRKHNRISWRRSGVELVRVPGEEKLRIRTSKGRPATGPVLADTQDAPPRPPGALPEDEPEPNGAQEPPDGPEAPETVLDPGEEPF